MSDVESEVASESESVVERQGVVSGGLGRANRHRVVVQLEVVNQSVRIQYESAARGETGRDGRPVTAIRENVR